MKNKILISLILSFFLYCLNLNNLSIAENLEFKAKEILTYEDGNKIIGNENASAKINNEFIINAEKFIYEKKNKKLFVENNVLVKNLLNDFTLSSKKLIYDEINNILIAEGNVKFLDKSNEINLESEKIVYSINLNEINSKGKTFVNYKKKYKFSSVNDLKYLPKKKIISSKFSSEITDNLNNKIDVSNFRYEYLLGLIKANNIIFSENTGDKFFLKNGMINLIEQKLIGKDIKVLLRNEIFGNKDNNPRLVGNSISYSNNKTIIKKGSFTTCKKNDSDCPPWQITSKEILHDKTKQEIHYKNAWLKIYDKPVMYFPKFFHPDPTVKRKSGFLKPRFNNSKNLGTSANIPYFFAISESSDLTFSPRIFSEEEYLIQTEARKELKNSSHILDFSINKNKQDKKNGQKTHFFSNSNFNLDTEYFDETFLDIKIEKVSNDNYTKLYSLESTSQIIKDTDVLESSVQWSGNKNNTNFDLSFESYETMNKSNNDRYEFVYPNFNFSKIFDYSNEFIQEIEISSSGSQKTFNTNVYEGVIINDLILTSNDYINQFGFNNKISTLLKNVNSHGTNSSKYKKDEQSEILSVISYDLEYPMIKNEKDINNFLTPKLSIRHSPNDTKNNKDESRLLDNGNIFSLNRIGFNDSVEGGSSLTLGFDYERKNQNKDRTEFSSSIATVFRKEEDKNLPVKSTLGKKQSDVVGKFKFLPNEILEFDYSYSLDNDVDQINLHRFQNQIQINNFVNKFIFYEENNLIGKDSYFENQFIYNLNEKNSLSFKTRENKKDNITEFYKLIYEYKNDCLTASVKYNKEYYTNNSLKPNEELFFNITLVPLGSTATENIID